ncbi:hypothetical protein ACF06V_38515 [Streptomyces bobili]|uniref:hypothetical protein n=1 Tax=Streptomyces bobili TaxID=67280 RepID=UPI0037001ABD
MFVLEGLSGIRDFFSRIGSLELSRIVKSLAIVAATLTAGLAVASPAQAAPYWQPVNLTSNWTCSTTEHHSASVNVLFQTCLVVSDDNRYAQAVLVVRNNAQAAVNISGTLFTNFDGEASCNTSKLNPGLVTGCFGPTKYIGNASPIYGYSNMSMNGISDTTTSITLV